MVPSVFLKHPVPYERYILFQEKARTKRKETILFLEHPPTITAGINYNIGNLLRDPEFLSKNGISLHFIKRGGDFTAHEPGQIVVYFHLDLKARNLNIADFLNAVLASAAESAKKVWDLDLVQKKESPGLYLAGDPERKILSIGVLFKSWFTSYGIALNLSNDFSAFRCIHPCGGDWKNMTSVSKLNLYAGDDRQKEWMSAFLSKFWERISAGKSELEPIN
ncbi:lipoyl(octanoyl) transferase [Leptospira fluminis]|uniref:Octanoyltransferase n=1 Tax=Leptospira fluminis TaxID=2484979 RepID=A0A4R9GNB2_9LEPT|nr:lipoyl(octanoyl) transferase LipB [Leptospira fluminis]TGK17331.1 lipoyl(octanoyl) transferase [Leptospira fluminis]